MALSALMICRRRKIKMKDKKIKKKSLSARVDIDFFNEITAESLRIDRSVAWIIKKSWQLSKDFITNLPSEEAKNE